MGRFVAVVGLALGALSGACSNESVDDYDSDEPPAVSAPEAAPPTPMDEPAPPADITGVSNRSGSAIALWSRGPDSHELLVADEDHAVLRRIALPLRSDSAHEVLAMPGRPAQVVALRDRVLVTIREPGLVIELRRSQDGELEESRRVEVASDAWGLAVSATGRTAVVTSAWTHRITTIDLPSLSVRSSQVVAREPRGVAIATDGTAWVSHLIGTAVTRLDDVEAEQPTLTRHDVPASRLRTPLGDSSSASLGYAAVLSSDEKKLFLPRHALGAHASQWWFGQATVDAMNTADASAVAPPRSMLPWGVGSWGFEAEADTEQGTVLAHAPFVQPRAAVYRRATSTLLVASEGTNRLVELDARAMDPSLATKRTYGLSRRTEQPEPFHSRLEHGGAPTGIALSEDDSIAYVYARSTDDVLAVALDTEDSPTVVSLAESPFDGDAAVGRELYYDATDPVISGGLGCSGCHPDGRDDGHVWHEHEEEGAAGGYRGRSIAFHSFGREVLGFARQTPMLAGRVSRPGPYGWTSESPNLETRIRVGFALHRWGGTKLNYSATLDRPKQLAAFVRQGLVAPRGPAGELSGEEQRGKEIFESRTAGCTQCHAERNEFGDGTPWIVVHGTPTKTNRAGKVGLAFEPEPTTPFKTPSLLFVGGTPPYFHDGSERSLEELLLHNGGEMGNTRHLEEADRRALASYLRTLGGRVEPFPADPVILPPPDRPASSEPVGPIPPFADWEAAPIIAREPRVQVSHACTVKRLGHWLHFACPTNRDHSLHFIAGGHANIQSAGGLRPFATFALREGERRVLHLTGSEFVGRWGGTKPTTAGIIQADWPLGAPEPFVSFN